MTGYEQRIKDINCTIYYEMDCLFKSNHEDLFTKLILRYSGIKYSRKKTIESMFRYILDVGIDFLVNIYNILCALPTDTRLKIRITREPGYMKMGTSIVRKFRIIFLDLLGDPYLHFYRVANENGIKPGKNTQPDVAPQLFEGCQKPMIDNVPTCDHVKCAIQSEIFKKIKPGYALMIKYCLGIKYVFLLTKDVESCKTIFSYEKGYLDDYWPQILLNFK